MGNAVVLVALKDQDVRHVVSAALRSEGYTVLQANDPSVSLIITDSSSTDDLELVSDRCQTCLRKPFYVDELMEAVALVLTQQNQQTPATVQ